jgi:hypothetical protein
MQTFQIMISTRLSQGHEAWTSYKEDVAKIEPYIDDD